MGTKVRYLYDVYKSELMRGVYGARGDADLFVGCDAAGDMLLCVRRRRTTARVWLFTIGAGWAIFSMGMAFGLALALAVLYFEILSRNLK